MAEPQRQPWPYNWYAFIVNVLQELKMDTSGTKRKITGLANGSSGTYDGCNVQQMEAYVTSAIGDNVAKRPVHAATTAALPANVRSGDVLTASANGAFPTIDGVAAALNNEYLVKDEGGVATHINDGIYTLTTLGTAGTKWKLTRRDDMEGTESASGAMVPVTDGTVAADTTFKCINNIGSDVVNTDALEFWFWGPTIDHANLKNLDWPSAGHTGLKATDVEVSEISTATYDDVQDLLNNTMASGYVDGGLMTPDGAAGDLAISDVKGYIRATNVGIAELLAFDISGITISAGAGAGDIIDLTTNYIYIDYTTNTIVATVTQSDVNGRSRIGLGKVFRSGTDLHILQAGMDDTEQMKRIQSRENSLQGDIVRTSGMAVSDEGTQNPKVTAGIFYAGYTKDTTPEVDTSVAGTFDEYYRDVSDNWYVNAAQTQINIANWNDITQVHAGALDYPTLTNNYYSNRWVYMDIDGHMLVVMGQGEYLKLADAEEEGTPTVSLGHIVDMSMLVSRITIKQGVVAFVKITSAFDSDFAASAVSVHNELSGLQGGTAGTYEHSDQGINTADTPEFAALKLTGSASPAYATKQIHFDTDKNAYTAFNENSNVALQLGEELWIQGKCKPAGGLLEGEVVFLDGVSGAPPFPYLSKAIATSGNAGKTIGMVTQPSAAQDATCFVTTFGLVRDLDTSSGGALDTGSQNWVTGTELFLSTGTAGKLTSTKPTANRVCRVGWVMRQHASEGVIFVSVKSIPGAAGIIIDDAGGIITATEVEAALQENRTAIDLNTTHRGLFGAPHQRPDVSLAGVAPIYADLTGASWADGDRGMGIGTGSREFYMIRRGSAVKYVELT